MKSEVRAEDIADLLLSIRKTENTHISLASQQGFADSLTEWRRRYKQNTSLIYANQCPKPPPPTPPRGLDALHSDRQKSGYLQQPRTEV